MRISDAGLKRAARGSLKIQDAKSPRDRPKTDFMFSAENGPKMTFHFRPETETKTATYFRPKTKLNSSSNNMRQSNVLLCEYANDAAQIQNYKSLDTKIEFCSEASINCS